MFSCYLRFKIRLIADELQAKTFKVRKALQQNTRSGVKYEITGEKEKQLRTFSDKVTFAMDFTDGTVVVVQCNCVMILL